MRDNSLNGSAEFGVVPLSDSGVLSGDESRVLKTLIKLGPGQNRSDIASECAPTGSGPVPKLDSTLFGLVATGHVNREGTLPPNHTWSITPKGTAAYRAHLRRPGGVSLGEISLGESGVEFGVVPLADGEPALAGSKGEDLGEPSYHMLRGLGKQGPMDVYALTRLVHNRMAGSDYPHSDPYTDPHNVWQHLHGLKKRQLVESDNKPNETYAITSSGKQAFLDHIKADPENAIRLGEG